MNFAELAAGVNGGRLASAGSLAQSCEASKCLFDLEQQHHLLQRRQLQ
jgi:hypothetical protein